MANGDLILFKTYNTTGTNEKMKEGTEFIKYGCYHPDQGIHTELCGGYTTGKTSQYHGMDWEINGRSHIILCDSTADTMYDLVYGSEKVDREMELNRLHRYSILIDAYGGTTTVTCPICGYVKSFAGSYSVYVEAYGTYAAGIRTQPASKSGNVDENFNFSISGINMAKYRWELFNNGSWVTLTDGPIGDAGVSCSGSTTEALVISGSRLALNGKKVRCTVTGLDYQELTSDEATLTVIDNRPPSLTIQKSTEELTPNPVIVTLSAEDPDGLNETPYSFDGGLTYSSNNNITVTENKTLNVAARDNSGNVTRGEVVIDNISGDAPEPEKIYLKGYVGKNGVAVRFL